MSRKKMRNRFSGSRIHCGEDGNEDQVSSASFNFLEEGFTFWERAGALSFLSINVRIEFSTMKRWQIREIEIHRETDRDTKNEDEVSPGHYNLFEKRLILGNGRFYSNHSSI